jgi:SAM-dependent methyltransferase/aryl carrier-like protein
LISATTGQLVSPKEITSTGYWRRHLRQTVRFANAMETLYQEGQRIFVEIGPHPTLLGMGRRCLPQLEDKALWLPSLRKGQDDWQELLESVGTLYVNGGTLHWAAFEHPYGGRKIPIPTYPWAKEYYWVEKSARQTPTLPPAPTAPLWEAIVEAGNRQAQHGPLDLAMQTYPVKWQAMEDLTMAYICRALNDLGVFTETGQSLTVDELISQVKILPNHAGMITRWLKHLVNKGYLTQTKGRFTSVQPLPDSIPDTTSSTLDDIAPLFTYINRCGEHLTDVLTGQVSPLDTLFPDGSYETVDYLYHHWPVIRYYNGILAAVVEKIANIRPAQQLRVLEIGAGTGGSTGFVLPELPADRTVYHFTDVSDFFLGRAQEKFSSYPFVQYGLLNIEKHPESQGYQPHSFDVIIAANAIHATTNLAQALEHVQWLLAPGGILLLLEGTNYLPWLDITTALIEGWELFDDDFRDDTPLLTPAQWQNALQHTGFERVALLPKNQDLAHLLIHNVVMAQTPATQGNIPAAFEIATHTDLSTSTATTSATALEAESLTDQLKIALPDDRRELLTDYVRTHIARILRLSAEHPLGVQDRLMDFGLDSLMAVELRSRLGKGLGLEKPLPATLIFDYPTIDAIVGHISQRFSEPTETPVDNESERIADADDHDHDISDLSDDEMEDLLLKKLQDLD